MEQHPIPKNVLTVEFKLFGALSVRQFLKVLVGSLIALFLFTQSWIHPIIRFPAIIISIAVGAASALLPGFDTKFTTLLRAIFISPRYVWHKSAHVPEVLMPEEKPKSSSTPIKVETKTNVPDIDDVGIEQVLEMRSQLLPGERTIERPSNLKDTMTKKATDQDEDGLAQIYHEVFGTVSLDRSLQMRQQQLAQVDAQPKALAGPATSGTQVPMGANLKTTLKPLQNSTPRPPSEVLHRSRMNSQQPNVANLVQSYQEELEQLQSQLQLLNKSGGDEQKRKQITDRISEIYTALRPYLNQTSGQTVTAQPGVPMSSSGKLVYGVVVDKKDKPVDGANVTILTSQGQELIHNVHTKPDGSFAIDAPLSPGQYVVHLEHPNLKFFDFKINIGSQQLPGYKFRAK